MDLDLLNRPAMTSTSPDLAPSLRALADDVTDLASALHLLGAAAAERGDADSRGSLRLLARYAESISDDIERVMDAAGGAR